MPLFLADIVSRAPADINNTALYRSTVDLTERTQACMREAYERRDEVDMFRCWSNASTYDDFGKSADMACRFMNQVFCVRELISIHSCLPFSLQPLELYWHARRWR